MGLEMIIDRNFDRWQPTNYGSIKIHECSPIMQRTEEKMYLNNYTYSINPTMVTSSNLFVSLSWEIFYSWLKALLFQGKRWNCLYKEWWIPSFPGSTQRVPNCAGHPSYRYFCSNCSFFRPSQKEKTMKNVQARHIPVSPGKEHTVELSGTHISTATNPDLWKLEGECEKNNIRNIFSLNEKKSKCGTHFLSTLAGLMQMKNLEPDKRGCRFSWESDSLTFYSRFFYIQPKVLQ